MPLGIVLYIELFTINDKAVSGAITRLCNFNHTYNLCIDLFGQSAKQGSDKQLIQPKQLKASTHLLTPDTICLQRYADEIPIMSLTPR
jgi:hypothetical protein